MVKHNMLMLSWKITLHIIMKKSYKLKTKVFLVDPVLVSIKKGKMSILFPFWKWGKYATVLCLITYMYISNRVKTQNKESVKSNRNHKIKLAIKVYFIHV